MVGIALLLAAAVTQAAPDRIVVDATRTIRPVPDRFLGLNVNYFLDDDRNPVANHRGKPDRPLAEALREMGVRRLRFPGGDKSDAHLWSRPPFAKPDPQVLKLGTGWWMLGRREFFTADGHWIADPLDFDEFIQLCRAADCEPVCVVAFDAMYSQEAGKPPVTDKQTLLDTATAWVKYSNISKRYAVRWWEIGNESYHAEIPHPTAAEYGRDAAEFAKAMKAVDPTIRIGLNGAGDARRISPHDRLSGSTDPWWKTVLAAAGHDADFVIAHDYPGWEWGRYETYPEQNIGIGHEAGVVARALQELLPPSDFDRYSIAMTEINAGDFTKDKAKLWENVADLGHAVVLADLIGKILWEPKAEMALVWNTRWFKEPDEPDPNWNTLDDLNRLTAAGQAVRMWKEPLRGKRLVWTEGSPLVGAYAIADPGLKIVLINRDLTRRTVDLDLAGRTAPGLAIRRVLAGSSPTDRVPVISNPAGIPVTKGRISVALDPVSVTVLELGEAR